MRKSKIWALLYVSIAAPQLIGAQITQAPPWLIVSDYGPRETAGAFHKGVDYDGNFGDAIKPVEAGIITRIRDFGDGGHGVEIQSGTRKWWYFHTFSNISLSTGNWERLQATFNIDGEVENVNVVVLWANKERQWAEKIWSSCAYKDKKVTLGSDVYIKNDTGSADKLTECVVTLENQISPVGDSGVVEGPHLHVGLNGGADNPLLYLPHDGAALSVQILSPPAGHLFLPSQVNGPYPIQVRVDSTAGLDMDKLMFVVHRNGTAQVLGPYDRPAFSYGGRLDAERFGGTKTDSVDKWVFPQDAKPETSTYIDTGLDDFIYDFQLGNLSLSDGEYTLEAIAMDVNNNPYSAFQSFRIDTTPVFFHLASISPLYDNFRGTSTLNPSTLERAHTLSFEDAVAGISALVISGPAGFEGYSHVFEPPVSTATLSFTDMPLGPYEIRAVDAAGNESVAPFTIADLEVVVSTPDSLVYGISMLTDELESPSFGVKIAVKVESSTDIERVDFYGFADGENSPKLVKSEASVAAGGILYFDTGVNSEISYSTHNYLVQVWSKSGNSASKVFKLAHYLEQMASHAGSYSNAHEGILWPITVRPGTGQGSFTGAQLDLGERPTVIPGTVFVRGPDSWGNLDRNPEIVSDGVITDIRFYNLPYTSVQNLGTVELRFLTSANADMSGGGDTLAAKRTYIATANPEPYRNAGSTCAYAGMYTAFAYCYTDMQFSDAVLPLQRYSQMKLVLNVPAPTGVLHESCVSGDAAICHEAYGLSIETTYNAYVYGALIQPQYYTQYSGNMVPQGGAISVPLDSGVSIAFEGVVSAGYVGLTVQSGDALPGFTALPAGHSYNITGDLSFNAATISFPYDPAVLGEAQAGSIKVVRVIDGSRGLYEEYPTMIDGGNKKVSARITAFGRYMVVAPAYTTPRQVSAGDVAGKPELEFISNAAVSSEKISDNSIFSGQMLKNLEFNGLAPVGSVYYISPDNLALSPAGAIRMRYDKAALAAQGLPESEIGLYEFTADGSLLFKLPRQTVNTETGEIIAEVPKLYSLFGVLGRSYQPPPTDIMLPETLLEYDGTVYNAESGAVYITTVTKVRLTASDWDDEYKTGLLASYYFRDRHPDFVCLKTGRDISKPAGTCENPKYDAPFTLEEGTHTIYYQSLDNANNFEFVKSTEVFVDATPPETSFMVNGVVYSSSATIDAVVGDTIAVVASDSLSNAVASGLAATYMLINVTQEVCESGGTGGGVVGIGSCEVPYYSAPFTLPEGLYAFYYAATDNVGNVSAIRSAHVEVGAARKTCYVDAQSGSDSNDGKSPAAAFKTIGMALAAAERGWTVHVASGVYHESIDISVPGVSVVGAAGAVLDGDPEEDYSDVLDYAVSMYADNAKLAGFTIRNYASMGVYMGGTGVELANNRIHKIRNNFAVYPTSCDGCRIHDNVISDSIAGIVAGFDNGTIEHNLIYNLYGVGINAIGSGNKITANTIFRAGQDTNLPYYSQRAAIVANSAVSPPGLLIRDNIIAASHIGLMLENQAAEAQPDHNAYWGNGRKYENAEPGPGDYYLNPRFADAGGGDFRLAEGSPYLGACEDGNNLGWYQGPGVRLAVPPDWEKTYYVAAASGSDANDGLSAGLAFKTISRGIAAARAGDTVIVAPGVYNESVTLETSNLTLRGQPGALLDGGNVLAEGLVMGVGVEDVRIEGFTIKRYTQYGISMSYWQNFMVTIASNVISGIPRAIEASYCDYCRIENNQLSGGDSGIWDSGRGMSIRGNLIYDMSNYGVFANGEKNRVINNTVYGTGQYGGSALGLAVMSYYPAHAIQIKSNIITNNASGIAGWVEGYSAEVTYNDVWGNGTNYDGVTPGAGDISLDPLFANASGLDFRLATGSPCLGAGEGGLNIGYYQGPGVEAFSVAASTIMIGGQSELVITSTAAYTLAPAEGAPASGALAASAWQGYQPVSTVYDIHPLAGRSVVDITLLVAAEAVTDPSELAIYRFDGVSWDSGTVVEQQKFLRDGYWELRGKALYTSLFAALMGLPDTQAPITAIAPVGASAVIDGALYLGAGSRMTLTAADPGRSGVAGTYYTLGGGEELAYKGPLTFPDGEYAITYWSSDKAGNSESPKTAAFFSDTSAPVSSHTVLGYAEYQDGTLFVGPASVISLSAADAAVNGASAGVTGIYYSVYQGAEPGEFQPYQGGLSFAAGAHTLAYYAVDGVGNREESRRLPLEVVSPSMLSAWFEPGTLNLKSNGQYISAYLEPGGDIVPGSLRISAVSGAPVSPVYPNLETAGKGGKYKHVSVGDANINGLPDLAIKFSRGQVIALLSAGEQAALRLEGVYSDGEVFAVEGYIRVIEPGLVRAGLKSVVTHPAAKVEIPQGALKEDAGITIARIASEFAPVEKRKNDAARGEGLARLGSAFEFGPEGLKFEEPVAITLPYDKAALAGGAPRLGYWSPEGNKWEVLASTVNELTGTVTGWTTHFSVYQVLSVPRVMAPAAAEQAPPAPAPQDGPSAEFRLGEVYVFPNPAKGGADPVFHVETGLADSVKITVYTVSGRQAHEQTLTGQPAALDDGNGLSYAYEYAWRGHIPSGVYYYHIEAVKAGQKLKKSGKFAVVR